MDGYIKSKKEAITSARRTILYKYACTFLILAFLLLWLFALAVNRPPAEWTHTEIVFSHLSEEKVGMRKGRDCVLNTQDGRKFVVLTRHVDEDELSRRLVRGETYSLVYSDTIAGGDHMEALYRGTEILHSLDDSIARWEREQQNFAWALLATLALEGVALLLIDRLWCKAEHSRIRKLKSDIKRRKNRAEKHPL